MFLLLCHFVAPASLPRLPVRPVDGLHPDFRAAARQDGKDSHHFRREVTADTCVDGRNVVGCVACKWADGGQQYNTSDG